MLSSIDFKGLGEAVLFHAAVLIIAAASLISGLLRCTIKAASVNCSY
ncbi:hypothetical protein [Erwinia billingiae]|jgi:hypothetical protein|nr:hypothetical protein [Erwinia billingiae]